MSNKKKSLSPANPIPANNHAAEIAVWQIQDKILQDMMARAIYPPMVISNDPIKTAPPKEENMYEREYEQHKYLKSRLADVVDDKREELREQFLIEWTDYPKTPAEFKQRVADGKFTWEFGNLKEDAELGYHGIGEWFSWRTQPADEKGYDVATEQLDKDATAVKDQAMLSYEDGLRALQQLEAKTYH